MSGFRSEQILDLTSNYVLLLLVLTYVFGFMIAVT